MVRKIVIAPDSFKETLTAAEAAQAIELGLQEVLPETVIYDKVPMADGGEGTMQSLHDALGGTMKPVKATDALGRIIDAQYSYVEQNKTAIIELAEASGLETIELKHRNPLVTSTYGTGQLILSALNQGAQKIILGIGGSATNDGGTGMMKALGVKFLDEKGGNLPEGGAALINLAQINISNLDKRLKNVTFEVVCDVDNPLLGPTGATHTYAKQKGASPKDIEQLEQALTHYNQVLTETFQHDYSNVPGAGAAGGTGIALVAFLAAELSRGIDIVLHETQLKARLKDADICITGEGKIDRQTIYGKTPIGVAKTAQQFNIPVIALCGVTGEGYEAVKTHGIDHVFSVTGLDDRPPNDHASISKAEALAHPFRYLKALAQDAAHRLELGKNV
ncbi:glycerate kinase [Staphylococcus simulans]|uniref:glycerate kinase n=1 Tax=Staphylococcus simulans TaxID=1286 RepID=UPI002900E6D1|nr:glycerate kinase [Staphylococcus simulans]MDU0420686.1 glycerate kinase [Staphylococcus simulans]MDU0467422.1 glycerate kinase [Staphylococcus simulans]